MNFMVRYRPDEQPFLRPHHDRYLQKIRSKMDLIFYNVVSVPPTLSMWPSIV